MTFQPSKTFGRKAVKLSSRQKLILTDILPRYHIPYGTRVDEPGNYFAGEGPVHLEIGFGSGEYTTRLAEACPDHRIIACELFQNGITQILQEIDLGDLRNIRIIHGDGIQIASEMFPDGAFDFIHINHPDPWPKKKHHKRRLIQPHTVSLFAKSLKAHGEIWLSTDVSDYAGWMKECLDNSGLFEELPVRGRFLDHLETRNPGTPLRTRYEEKGKSQGRITSHLCYRRR